MSQIQASAAAHGVAADRELAPPGRPALPPSVAAEVLQHWAHVVAPGGGDAGDTVLTGVERDGYLARHYVVYSAASTPGGSTRRPLFLKVFAPAAAGPHMLRSQTALISHCSRHTAPGGRGARSDLHFITPAVLPAVGSGALFVGRGTDGSRGFLVAYEAVEGHVLHEDLLARPGGGGADGAEARAVAAAVGSVVARISAALAGFRAPNATRVLPGFEEEAVLPEALGAASDERASVWDLRHALQHRAGAALIAPERDGGRTRRLVERAFADFEARLLPLFAASEAAGAAANAGGADEGAGAPRLLRRAWLHGDLNDCNLIVREPAPPLASLRAEDLAIVDYDDACYSYLVHEAAIALTYIFMWVTGDVRAGAAEPAAASLAGRAGGGGGIEKALRDVGAHFVEAFCRSQPLRESEVRALVALVRTRVATSLVVSAQTLSAEPNSERAAYILVHAAPASTLLAWLYGEGEGQGGGGGGGSGAAAGAALADAVEASLTASWLAAAAAGGAAGRFPATQAYVPHTLETLAPAQVAASRAAIAALARLGDEGAFGAVIEPPRVPAAVAGGEGAATTAGGALMREPVWPASARRGALESAWEAAPPFVYDWSASGAAEAAGEGGAAAGGAEDAAAVGARLERFTQRSLAPLVDARTGVLQRLGWGKYMEDRTIYTTPLFGGGGDPRTWHLGVDLGAPAGVAVLCPLAGEVHSWAFNAAAGDYGATIVLRHLLEGSGGEGGAAPSVVYTLYGHLSTDSVLGAAGGAPRLRVGQHVARGERIGSLGTAAENGGWPPHVHFQIVTELAVGGFVVSRLVARVRAAPRRCLSVSPAHATRRPRPPRKQGDFPGVCGARSRAAYALLTPDPNLILRNPFVAREGW